jgi:hypothetical protein
MRQKPTIRDEILKRFRMRFREGYNNYINAQVIEDYIHKITYKKHETIGRELRRMAEEMLLNKNEIKEKPNKIASIYYQYIPLKNEILSMGMKNKN